MKIEGRFKDQRRQESREKKLSSFRSTPQFCGDKLSTVAEHLKDSLGESLMESSTRRISIYSIVLSIAFLFAPTPFSRTACAQVTLTAATEVNVRAAASRTSKIIGTLRADQKVMLESPRGRRNFFKVRLDANSTGWVHGDYLLLPDVESMALTPEVMAAAAAMPLCGLAAHYRWREKTSTAGFSQQPTSASAHAVLQWAPLPFGGHTISSWCKDRSGRELRPFSVLGWVRRTRNETDGDVHIEITMAAGDPVGDCVVVEIPPANLSQRIARARNDLASLLSVGSITDKDFDTPVRLRFTGLAFWDGWHATSSLPSGHGRCNSTMGAAWELHPVFKVAVP
jgi:hypothetical protein